MGKKKLTSVSVLDCPCGALNHQGKRMPFDACCSRLILDGEKAHNPEELMRSRYSAYVLNHFEYLRQTWHPDTCPVDLSGDRQIKWLSLQVLSSRLIGVNEGEVCFIARYKYNGRAEKLQERSRFTKLNNLWVYVDGDIS